MIDDVTLVAGLRRGSSESHVQLWEKYGDILIRFLSSLGANYDDAADAAVNGVAKAVEKIDQFDPQKAKGREPFRNWLFTITRRVWHDQQRKQKHVVDLYEDFRDPSTEADTENPFSEALNQALSALPENQRQTITMHFYDSLPLSEIARLKGVPEGTVRQWKRRALAALQLALKDLPVFADLVNRD